MTGHQDPQDPQDRRTDDMPEGRDREMVLSEEQLRVSTQTQESGRVRAVKSVDTEAVTETVPRGTERAGMERADVAAGDSGEVETLPDGSLSIPVFEEELVITKRLVVRERVIIRKHTVYEEHIVHAELRKERLDVTAEGDVEVIGDAGSAPRG